VTFFFCKKPSSSLSESIRQTQCRSGFTIVELLIVVSLIAVGAAIAYPVLEENREQAKIKHAIGDIRAIEHEIDMFEIATERLPHSLDEIGRGAMLDPWDNPYVYSNFRLEPGNMRRDKNLKPINSSYDLYSIGEDLDTKLPLTAKVSRDDIVRASDGAFCGLGEDY
jgi:general secretion pathway protein G